MSNHLVAIFGGAVSGAEAAHQLAERGIPSVVFEQSKLPYGKIEDGLPKWHVKLRDKEEANIDEKLRHPLVTFVPNVKLGSDINLEEVANEWGFSAVLLATGAWRDRPLPIDGIEAYENKGFYYQNPFMYWFNHYHEPGYDGPQMQPEDGALIVGGGLASIDVAKALMMIAVRDALNKRGEDVNIFMLERSIAKALEERGVTLSDLGIKGCTLVYRKRVKDMPLYPGDTDTPEKLAKAEIVREKVLSVAQNKYLFNVLPLHVAEDKIVEDGRLKGLVLRKTIYENGRLNVVHGSEQKFFAPLVISSIGSVPEPIPGIPVKGDIFSVDEEDCCRISGFKNVFALGNAVTGRGNIKESMQHGKDVSQTVADCYLTDPEEILQHQLREKESIIESNVNGMVKRLATLSPPSEGQRTKIMSRVQQLQKKSGYDGNYDSWIKNNLPERLEKMLGVEE